MKILVHDVGKRYPPDWILRHVDLKLEGGKKYALTGPNGSGKSTLMKLLSGYLAPSRGRIVHYNGKFPIPPEKVYHFVAFAAPYMDLIEEFSLLEAIRFHRHFKPFRAGMQDNDVLDRLRLHRESEKPLRVFSSGMKQRVKLALALFSDVPFLLLDEPTTNLDREGADWYAEEVSRLPADTLLVVASNTPADYEAFDSKIAMKDLTQKAK